MGLQLHTVASKAEVRRFVGLAKTFYRGDPGYVPPIEWWLRRRLIAKRPWDPDEPIRLFVAERDGDVVGTIGVYRDALHDKHKDDGAVFFGFFETVDDDAVCDLLLARANAEAERWGGQLLRGPRGLTRVDEIGILVEGHGLPPMLASHHPGHYRRMLEDRGFDKNSDRFAYEIELSEGGRPRPIPDKLRERANAVDIPGLAIRSLQWTRLERDLDLAYDVFLDAFRSVPENTPWSKPQFKAFGRVFLLFANRHMLQIATVNGKAAGFALCFPELNEAIVKAHGKLLPTGALRLVRGLRHVRTASFKLFGVLPEYRGSGLHALLIRHAIEGIRRVGYDRLEASLVDERNGPMRHIIESAGCTPYRRYRVYDRQIS